MKFYGIDMQGKYLVEEADITPATSENDRRFVRDTTDGRLYVSNTGVGNYVELISDYNYTTLPTQFKASLDGKYHLAGGDASTALQASILTGPSDLLVTTDHWLKLASGADVTVADLPAGINVEAGGTDATLFYDGADDTADSHGLRWKMNGPDYTAGPQIVATREFVAANYLTGTGSGIGSGDLANYYTKTQIDASWIYSSALKSTYATILDADNWLQLICYHETSAPAWATLTATVSNSFNNVVRRDASGDIYATTGHLVATSALYADLAEKYTCDESLPIGTVVAVACDGVSEYEVVPYDFDNAFNVVGVVSENPAHVMNAGSEGLPIALTGRVPVRVMGEVKKGDFVVPSTMHKGCAIKGNPETNYKYKIGIVLETNLHDGEKMVECIIK